MPENDSTIPPRAPQDAQEGFYVSIRRGSRAGLLLGPFARQDEAASAIPLVQEQAQKVDRMSVFDAFGVARATPKAGRALPSGRLNAVVGLT